MIKTISIDWLQLYCDGSKLTMHASYTWLKMDYQTKQFRELYEVTYRGELIATVVKAPTSPIIPASSMIVKFSNRVLYGQNLGYLIEDFLNANNIVFKSITRVDICTDFNYFFNGYCPENFIKDFLQNRILKNGRGKFTVIGEQKRINSYQYLRFGSKTSEVNVYLYNKSVELVQVLDKPHIRKLWQEKGLDTTKNIWRLEISIKSKGNSYLDTRTGELNVINYDDLLDQSNLQNIFNSYINQYFHFKINDFQSNKSRMKKLKLFANEEFTFKPLYLPNQTGAAKAEKVFLKKLYQFDQEMRGATEIGIDDQRAIISDFINATNLHDYFNEKKVLWDRQYLSPN